jgi:hypothetical protein
MVLAQPQRSEQTELHRRRADIVPAREIDESPVVVVAELEPAPQWDILSSGRRHATLSAITAARRGGSAAPSAGSGVNCDGESPKMESASKWN